MTITFVSNYINHHQIPLSNELYAVLGDDYAFIQTEPMEKERKRMGWGIEDDKLPPYVILSYEDQARAGKKMMESDLVIFGGARDQELILPRLLAGKLTLRYSERIYKEGQWKFISPRGLQQKYKDHIRFSKAPVYMLCAGGYVASDFHLIHAYKNKMLRFGYFPEFTDYGEGVHAKRLGLDVEILWAGRFIDWKHPEAALYVMKALKEKGLSAHMTMIGGGELLEEMHDRIERENLTEDITLTGFMKPSEVRIRMNGADIFLFTSDYKEGWGAVLNEAMNAGCACVCNEGIGAVPYLIENGKNGFTYKNGDLERAAFLVEELVTDKELCLRTGRLAYETIRSEWNPKMAARRLLDLTKKLMEKTAIEADASPTPSGKLPPRVPRLSELDLPTSGPCSIAPIIHPGIRN